MTVCILLLSSYLTICMLFYSFPNTCIRLYYQLCLVKESISEDINFCQIQLQLTTDVASCDMLLIDDAVDILWFTHIDVDVLIE